MMKLLYNTEGSLIHFVIPRKKYLILNLLLLPYRSIRLIVRNSLFPLDIILGGISDPQNVPRDWPESSTPSYTSTNWEQ